MTIPRKVFPVSHKLRTPYHVPPEPRHLTFRCTLRFGESLTDFIPFRSKSSSFRPSEFARDSHSESEDSTSIASSPSAMFLLPDGFFLDLDAKLSDFCGF